MHLFEVADLESVNFQQIKIYISTKHLFYPDKITSLLTSLTC